MRPLHVRLHEVFTENRDAVSKLDHMTPLKDTVILYHASCTDGFGSAFAAYSKYKDEASYIPVRYQVPPPAGLDGKDVYILDFSYPKDTLQDLLSRTKSLTILDHHKTAKDDVLSIPNSRYADDHSGAYLSWEFFHPTEPVPQLIKYVEDGDLFRRILPHSEDFLTYLYVRNFNFAAWEQLVKDCEDPEKLKKFADLGRAYAEYRDHLVDRILLSAELVEFEGHQVYAVNGVHELRDFLGTKLAERTGKFGICWYQQFGSIDVSLRGSHGPVDVSAIAQKYGGGGHFGAAGFRILGSTILPWKVVDGVKKEE